jgi:hypothetical protein
MANTPHTRLNLLKLAAGILLTVAFPMAFAVLTTDPAVPTAFDWIATGALAISEVCTLVLVLSALTMEAVDMFRARRSAQQPEDCGPA